MEPVAIDRSDDGCNGQCGNGHTWTSGGSAVAAADHGICTKGTPAEARFSNAIATAISNGWMAYQSTIKIPGLPWYPAFAAFPGPFAPPTPNVPCPVIALTQVTVSVSANALSGSMVGLLGDPTALHHKQLFDSVADAFEKCFMTWQTSTQVTNVLGAGPIPTFAPPFVPCWTGRWRCW